MSFKDLRLNGYHIETVNENKKEYMYLVKRKSGNNETLEKLEAYSSGLYFTYISPIETYLVSNHKVDNQEMFNIWHDRLGHPGTSMMIKIIKSSNGHPLNNIRIPQSNELHCKACSLGKLIIRPSKGKLEGENLAFLERIQGDICGPIHPTCGVTPQ